MNSSTHSALTSQLLQWHLDGKKVFVRIDADVPLKNGIIVNDYRLQAALPTLQLIKQHKGTIILATHIGRPSHRDAALSTKVLIPWLEHHGFTVRFAPTLDAATTLANTTADIVLLENLRFFAEEQHPNKPFAKRLADLADFYVNECFGSSHRNDTSISLVPTFFDKNHRTVGLHCAQEIRALTQLMHNPPRPFICILGGGKVADKLPYLATLLPHVDAILLCPALVFTFLKAQGYDVGQSLVASDQIEQAKKILALPSAQTKFIFPIDYQVAEHNYEGRLSTIDANHFKETMIGIAIGPKTITRYIEIMRSAGSIFFNGPMGFQDRPATMQATEELLHAIAQASAYSIIAGGDSVAAAYTCDVASNVDQLSTGGGACLAFLSGVNLPGLIFFM